jgi:hypothetical protein
MSMPRRYSPSGTKFNLDVNENPDPERMLLNIRPLSKTKQGRFVRPEKEHKEQPAQTLYTVDDDDEVVKEEKSAQNVAKSPTNTWGDNMFQNQNGRWKCGTCWSYNDLEFTKCSSCEAEKTPPTQERLPKRAKREANIFEKDDANTSTSAPAHSETTASAAPFSFSSLSVKADAKAAVGGRMVKFDGVGSEARSTSTQTSVSFGEFALGSASELKPDNQKDQPTSNRKRRRATDDDDKG